MNELITKGRLIYVLGLQFIIATSQVAHAEQLHHGEKHIHGAHKECPLPKTREDIVSCALEFHPSIKRGDLKIESVSKLEEKASQIPNPTFSSRYVEGDDGGKDGSDLETNLSFTVELGGKRGSRKEYARAQLKEASTSHEALKAEVKIATILNMHRLRQVMEEKKLLTEALSAFNKVIAQLKKLPRLSAEQEASLTLFEFALEESKVKESEIFEQERKLEHYFHVATGHSIEEIKRFLPSAPKRWPKIGNASGEGVSPEVKKLKSLASLAHMELEIQKSHAWPDLKVGPSFSIEKEGDLENKMLGFNIQIPIPLFQANGGGKAHARSELIRAQKNITLTKAEENHERFEQLRVYESAVSILNKTMKLNEVEKKHNRIEKLYLRGVVSSSVFLDSLKQKLSYLATRNNREMTALKALWSIHKYDGKIFEERI